MAVLLEVLDMLEPGVFIYDSNITPSHASLWESETIFENIDAFNPNVDTYRADDLPERESELDDN